MNRPISHWLKKLAGLGFYGGYDVCGKPGIPFVIAALQPLAPTSAFSNLFFPAAKGK